MGCVKYYMIKANDILYDLETDFYGLTIESVSGLNSMGKAKNIFKREWAEGVELDVYIPEKTNRELGNMSITFSFSGANVQSEFECFMDYVSSNVITYWDTYRNKKVDVFLEDGFTPSKEQYRSNMGYVKGEIKFTIKKRYE